MGYPCYEYKFYSTEAKKRLDMASTNRVTTDKRIWYIRLLLAVIYISLKKSCASNK